MIRRLHIDVVSRCILECAVLATKAQLLGGRAESKWRRWTFSRRPDFPGISYASR